MILLDEFKADIAQHPNTHDRRKVRRIWWRAVCETLFERQLSPIKYPARRNKIIGKFCEVENRHIRVIDDYTTRFVPYWRTIPEPQLNELYLYLKPYFMRKENRDDDCS